MAASPHAEQVLAAAWIPESAALDAARHIAAQDAPSPERPAPGSDSSPGNKSPLGGLLAWMRKRNGSVWSETADSLSDGTDSTIEIWRHASPPASPRLSPGRVGGPRDITREEACYCELHPGISISVRHHGEPRGLSYVAF
eukprot:CAMPEP_0180130656 /NCGR_PEP_ID=MMETSP0986-20121125/7986_1 /TAXON_ID=697907 /ORGANISM="non described non described, Strain CCMP2293" /LENGTH=140 /DNA_ID=CAMNT_0022070447 /DNA_START=34 /DNA_END=456 /DNA_ORIENTATION=+